MPKRRDPRTRFEEDVQKGAVRIVKAIRALHRLAVTNSRGTAEEWARVEFTIQEELRVLREITNRLPPEQQIDLFGTRGEGGEAGRKKAQGLLEQMRSRSKEGCGPEIDSSDPDPGVGAG